MSNVKPKTWKDISLASFYKIQELLREQDEYTVFNLLDLIYGIDTYNMKVTDVANYSNGLAFLKEDIKEEKIKKVYTINGRKYNADFDLTGLTVAQFVDYQNYIKKQPVLYEDVLSVFLVPADHKYNDGYDLQQVKDDILSMCIVDVRSISFFFVRQLRTFLFLFQSYLTETVRKMELPKEEKKHLYQLINNPDLHNLELYPTSLNTVRLRMRGLVK